jgi:PhzF family phenazine biosynthesis protein
VQIDAFTRTPCTGNAAAVCLLDFELAPQDASELPDACMQAIAAENNLSETVFVSPLNHNSFQEASKFSLRWFTPTVEVPLCGHATMAAAAALFFGVPRMAFCVAENE